MDAGQTAAAVIAALGLQPHPEGGHYRETWRDRPAAGRGAGTAILFLLAAGETSHWHRVDATELWIWQAGAPLTLSIATGTTAPVAMTLDSDRLHGVAPAHAWQAAVSLGAWTLVTCVVTPAFEFAGFELAPPDWQPG
jgi:predicted cupin superfamily sugar epimerase